MVGIGFLFDKNPELKLQSGKLEKFTSMVNIKAFYMELHDHLVAKGFKDMLQPANYVKGGEWVNAGSNENRTSDIFETEYTIIDNGWAKEIEIRWETWFNISTSQYGNVIFKLYLVCRNMQDKEILEGNQKKVMQSGSWEFRNDIIYKNTIVKDFLSKIPYVKNYRKLQEIYIDRFYGKKLEEDIFDITLGQRKAGIYAIIHKHFT